MRAIHGAALVALLWVGCVGAGQSERQAAVEDAGAPDAVVASATLAGDPAAVAERIARFFWDAPADPSVAARLASEPVERVAQDMLADPRTARGLEGFFTWWLRLDELAAQPRDSAEGLWTEAVRTALAREPAALGAHVVMAGDGTLEQLLNAPFTMMSAPLAAIYGVPVEGEEMRPVAFPSAARRGIFGTAGALARYAAQDQVLWPPRRFWMLSETMLCDVLSTPSPPSFAALDPPDDPAMLRSELDKATAPPSCNVCHSFVNPIGYAFMAFDNLGRLTSESLASANETVQVNGRGDLTFNYQGGQPGLMRSVLTRLASRKCFVEQLLVYAVDRKRYRAPGGTIVIRAPIDALAPTVEALTARFDRAGGAIRSAMTAIVSSPEFLDGRLPTSN